MIRAYEVLGLAAIVRHESSATMLADVVEGPDASIVIAGNEDGLAAEVENHMLAGLGDVAFKRRNQPRLCPHPLPFLRHVVG